MWYQIVSACVNVGLAWQDQFLSNRINKKMLRSAAKTAEYKAKIAEANFERRSAYRNEELGQAVWNIAQQGQEMMGAQRASMAASGFDTSTGDQRILADTYRRNLEKISGMNRTAYLQQFEDEIQTNSDILQYNYEAYANRAMVKNYSGIRGFAKIVDAGGRAFVNSANQGLFNGKGQISSNTGAQGSGWGKDLANQNFSSNSALGNFSDIAGKSSYGKLSGFSTSAFNKGVSF